MNSLDHLLKRIRENKLFTRNRTLYIRYFEDAFRTEISYLKSAYISKDVLLVPDHFRSPSEILFPVPGRFEEIDRTFTSILALNWIYHRDYDSFTENQPEDPRLKPKSFEKLCDFFHAELDDFEDAEKLLALITLQITNDLGKSAELKRDFDRLKTGDNNANHEMLLHEVLTHHPELIPSIYHSKQRSLICELVHLASQHNPGRFVQGECPAALLDVLHNVGIKAGDLRLKYMEVLLDVSGARGHITHNGAVAMTEDVFQAYDHACKIAQYVLQGGGSDGAWKDMLDTKVEILKERRLNWMAAAKMNVHQNRDHCAEARLLAMSRTTNFLVADAIVYAFDKILDNDTRQLLTAGLTKYGTAKDPAVVPAYMSEMMAALLSKLEVELDTVKKGTAFAPILCYLARVLRLTDEDRNQIEEEVVVVERNVLGFLKPIIEYSDFLPVEECWPLINEKTPLPGLKVVRRRKT